MARLPWIRMALRLFFEHVLVEQLGDSNVAEREGVPAFL